MPKHVQTHKLGFDARLQKNAAILYKAASDFLEAFDARKVDLKQINELRAAVASVRG